MNAVPLVLGAMLVLALAYRYYGAFIAAKVLALDDSRATPAHALNDGQNYHPTNKWVLFGHHFAAISGAGPLIGPVLAAQFGYAPTFIWLLLGAVIAGSVHDIMILVASVRRNGKSLAEIARQEVSPVAGAVGSVAVLIIIVLALAGLGFIVAKALEESSWGTFTIGMTIPVALFVGLWMYRFRKGHIVEGSIIGVIGVLAAVVIGSYIPGSSLEHYFSLSKNGITTSIAIYGFIASVLPVWMLLCPRDYLSSYLKIGTIFVLIVGVLVVHPDLKMPAITPFINGGGPIIPGKLFPFLFITIACGAISGFHSLIGSGTTPKMIGKESDAKVIGFGAMLMECLVSVVALVAACSLDQGDYFAINTQPAVFKNLGMTTVHLDELTQQVGEKTLAGRTGGAVSLAVGFAQILASIPGMKSLMSYWYHFAIMFEALFILTTIDTGTRVARFLVQEAGGRIWKPFGKTDWWPSVLISTGLVVSAWAFFIFTGSIGTIWPMFGAANQLLAAIALTVATTALINAGKVRYVWTTAIPMVFVTITTLYAGWRNVFDQCLPMALGRDKPVLGTVNTVLTLIIMVCAVVVLLESIRRWYRVLAKGEYTVHGRAVNVNAGERPPNYGEA